MYTSNLRFVSIFLGLILSTSIYAQPSFQASSRLSHGIQSLSHSSIVRNAPSKNTVGVVSPKIVSTPAAQATPSEPKSVPSNNGSSQPASGVSGGGTHAQPTLPTVSGSGSARDKAVGSQGSSAKAKADKSTAAKGGAAASRAK